MDKEWNRSRFMKRPDPNNKGVGVWDEKGVMEFHKVKERCGRMKIVANIRESLKSALRKTASCPRDANPENSKDVRFTLNTTFERIGSNGLYS